MFKEELKFIKILSAGFFVGLGLVFFVAPASAVTPLAGYPSGAGGVMSLANSPYVVTANISVPAGQTLTIEPGVIVKMQSGRSITTTNGNIVIGSASNPSPVVITSYKDDAYGGDTNNDGSTSPGRGDWNYIQVSSASSQLTINHALIRYGGSASSMVQVLSGVRATIANTTIEFSNNTGLGIRNGDSVLTLTDSIIRNNYEGLTISWQADASVTGTTFSGNRQGLAIDADADIAHLSITNNTFSGNNWATGALTPAGLDFADLDDTLIVINNDWGSTSGPTIASNPGGTGDRIIGNVTYDPWTGQNQPPTLSYVGTSGYTTDGVEPNISFKTQSLPVFKVSYSDPEGVVSYVRLVTASSTLAMATSTGGVYEFSAATSTFAKASYSYHFEASDGTNTARLPASGELSFEVKNIPVILVPGIMGTEMKQDIGQTSFTLWPNIEEMIPWWLDDFMDPLAMNTDGSPSDNSVVIRDVVRKVTLGLLPVYNYFSGIVDQLEDNNYIENTDLFVFPYDWRLDIRNSSQKLKDRIDAVLTQTGSQKVDVVAHSMGGLVSKQYILDNTSSKIDKLIFVGTPHLGSPKSAKMLLFGDHLIKIFLSFLNPGEMKYLAQNMPSVYELLPSSSYFTQVGRYIYDLTDSSQSFDYQGTKQYLTNTGRNSALLQNADNFHTSALDDFDADNLDAYNIIGCDSATLGKILIRNNRFTETEYGLELTPGDGTVPLRSANAVDLPANKVFYAKGVEHATMPSQLSIRQLIAQIITGDVDISSLSDIMQNINQCVFNGQIVSVYSPVDLHVYDSLGNHVGPNSSGDIELNIPGATYEQIGSDKFVFLPNTSGVSYNIQLDGTGNGTFSLRVEKVESSQVTETAYYNDIPVTESAQAQISLGSTVSATVLQVDQNGTGSFSPVAINAVLNATQSTDITKPSSAITVSGSSLGGDRYQTSATVSLTVTDDNAGILKTEYSLNSGSTWNTYSNSFIITTLGSNTIQYRATDRAGNVESTKSKAIEIVAAPNAVIIVPQSSSKSTEVPKQNSNIEPTPQVLGEERERPINEQYTKEQILDALAAADTSKLLDYLGKTRDTLLEARASQVYGKYFILDKAAVNFIAYGTKSTLILGEGERANVLRSYKQAFGSLPKTASDWEDLINIATSQLPKKRNNAAEQRAVAVFKKVYNQEANLSDEKDARSIMTMAYGLRPEKRDLEKEKSGIKVFVSIYRYLPRSIVDWDITRAISYN